MASWLFRFGGKETPEGAEHKKAQQTTKGSGTYPLASGESVVQRQPVSPTRRPQEAKTETSELTDSWEEVEEDVEAIKAGGPESMASGQRKFLMKRKKKLESRPKSEMLLSTTNYAQGSSRPQSTHSEYFTPPTSLQESSSDAEVIHLLGKAVESKDKTIKQLEQEVTQLKRRFDHTESLAEQVESLTLQVSQLESEKEQLEQSESSHKEEVDSLNARVKQLQILCGKFEDQYKSARSDVHRLASDLAVSKGGRTDDLPCTHIDDVDVTQKLEEKDDIISKLQRKLATTVAELKKVQEHSKKQSKDILQLKDKSQAAAVEGDREYIDDLLNSVARMEEERDRAEEMRCELEKKLQAAVKDKEYIQESFETFMKEYQLMRGDYEKQCELRERAEVNFDSVAAQAKEMKRENAILVEQLKKLGEAHVENSELEDTLNKKSATIKQLTEELEGVKAQAMVYKADFEAEREDRARAQTQRAEEGEKYEKEIKSLKAKLQEVTAGSIERESRQRESYEPDETCEVELMYTRELLKSAQEDVQNKTAQVKQYRKESEQVSAQLTALQHDHKELQQDHKSLDRLFQETRKQLAHAKSSDVDPPKVFFQQMKEEKKRKASRSQDDAFLCQRLEAENRDLENENSQLKHLVKDLQGIIRERDDQESGKANQEMSNECTAGKGELPHHHHHRHHQGRVQPAKRATPFSASAVAMPHISASGPNTASTPVDPTRQRPASQPDPQHADYVNQSFLQRVIDEAKPGNPKPYSNRGVQDKYAQRELLEDTSGPQSLPNKHYKHQHSSDPQQRQHKHQPVDPAVPRNDPLSIGIDTQIHAVAERVVEEKEHVHVATDLDHSAEVPFDPNLNCVACERKFRIGEIQLYRSHVKSCKGPVT